MKAAPELVLRCLRSSDLKEFSSEELYDLAEYFKCLKTSDKKLISKKKIFIVTLQEELSGRIQSFDKKTQQKFFLARKLENLSQKELELKRRISNSEKQLENILSKKKKLQNLFDHLDALTSQRS
jgi:hypothetical protein